MTLIEQYVGKSFGGMCDDFVELLDARGVHAFPDIKKAAFEEEVVPAEGYLWEKLFYVPDTARFEEREVLQNGAIMKQCELRFLVASDKHTNVDILDLISRLPWHVKFRDQNHRLKIIGGRNGRGAFLRPVLRNNKQSRADRNEYEVVILYTDSHPVVEYKFGNTDLYPPPPPTTVMKFNSTFTGNGHSNAVGFAIGLMGQPNVTIDWGDGNTEVITTDGDVFHQYSAAGEYTVSIISPNSEPIIDIEAAVYGTYENCTLNITSVGELGHKIRFEYQPQFDSCGAIYSTVKLVRMQGSGMPQSNIDSILVNLDDNGELNGTCLLNLNIPSNPPSATGNAAKTSLISKGWTVTTD
jgi:hypothetical protein